MLELTHRVRAGCPAIAVESYEPDRFIAELRQEFPKRTILQIDARGFLQDTKTGAIIEMTAEVEIMGKRQRQKVTGYSHAFNYMTETKDTFLVALDFQHNIAQAPAYRPLIAASYYCKKNQAVIILIGPIWKGKLPAELQHELPILEHALPNEEQLAPALEIIEEGANKKIPAAERKSWLTAGRGLTVNEYETAAAMAAIGGFKPRIIEVEKMRLINSSPAMSYEEPISPDQLGGLGEYKDFILKEVIPSLEDDQLRVRAILADGLAGTGKSRSTRVAASMLRWPLVGFDISACKGSLQGQSEERLRGALKLAEAVAPCLLRFDEFEKAVGGSASSAKTDGGVMLAMEGTLLTFMEETTAPIIIVATCNDSSKLSDPMRRRFDAHFFFDIPGFIERQEIATIHLARFGVELDGLPQLIAEKTNNWTGAEIERMIKSASRRTRRKVTPEAIDIAASDIHPIALDPTSNITELRDWAKSHLKAANTKEVASAVKAGRRIG